MDLDFHLWMGNDGECLGKGILGRQDIDTTQSGVNWVHHNVNIAISQPECAGDGDERRNYSKEEFHLLRVVTR